MRYKVKAPSLECFRSAERIVRADTQVFVALASRRTLSTGDISEQARAKLEAMGVVILPEGRYSLERSTTAFG
ncbi:hypothetical protein K3175_05885 [Qipengyuania sp. GH1]|uniref:hypothetical protein n=1 Tax=Qipengyuania aestuarii TaxID=2867241 RepID=UPI001C87392E|nr:hypothetical protein [Qipengyuania aestuarii]MBX7535184.1 hypothetical protein [Qipengyuania aestuarii]